MSQGPPNPGFMQEKVQKGDFLKKDSRESKFFSCFRFLWISQRPGRLNWERVFFGCLKTFTSSVSSIQLSIYPMKIIWNEIVKWFEKNNFKLLAQLEYQLPKLCNYIALPIARHHNLLLNTNHTYANNLGVLILTYQYPLISIMMVITISFYL